MKTKILALFLLVGSSVFAGPRVFFGVGIGGPAFGYGYGYRYYAPPPPPPAYGYAWVPGYYYPVGPRYSWRTGYWAHPPYAGAYWVGPRYYGGRYYRGYWRR